MTSISGPTIAMRSNPSPTPTRSSSYSPGDSADDVLTAALAFTLQRDLLDGPTVRISSLKMPASRQPDDAPRWPSTDKVTHIGDIAGPDIFETDGAAPIAIYLRAFPPISTTWRLAEARNLPRLSHGVSLGVRQRRSNDSNLKVILNGFLCQFDSQLPQHTDKTSAPPETIVPLPVSDLRPFSNSFLTRFFFLLSRKDDCQDTAPSDLKGAVLKDSYLDIQGIPHWAALPNLEIFANAGYPFTRKADLADTAVVLPDTPSDEEIEMYLTFMGHFGSQTGYPVLNVSVTNADGMKSDRRKDYLVLGTVDDQPALRN